MIAWMMSLPLATAIPLLFVENLAILVLAVAAGELIARRFADRRVSPEPPAIERLELALVGSTLILNSAVTVAGLMLWRAGVITIRDDFGLRAIFDVVVLLVAMDVLMYVLHRLAHAPILYGLLHRPHHRYDKPRPLTLFVLHPAETIAFGSLWLAVITVYSPSWLGMIVYLVLNVVFGTVGHLGVEPLPASWAKHPLLGAIAGGAFHAGHHQDPAHNYGFYTTIWDRLFRTLRIG